MVSKDEVKSFVLNSGADFVGIADPFKLSEISGKKKNPISKLQDVRTVIVFGIVMPKNIIEIAPEVKYQVALTNSFRKLRHIAKKVSRWLEKLGYSSYPCHDQKDIEHKKAAELSGLGKVGKHTLLITPKFGPRVHLNSVLTNFVLDFDTPTKEDLCSECNECIQKCPSDAIKSQKTIVPQTCLGYRIKHIKGGYCGICMKTCWEHFTNSSN